MWLLILNNNVIIRYNICNKPRGRNAWAAHCLTPGLFPAATALSLRGDIRAGSPGAPPTCVSLAGPSWPRRLHHPPASAAVPWALPAQKPPKKWRNDVVSLWQQRAGGLWEQKSELNRSFPVGVVESVSCQGVARAPLCPPPCRPAWPFRTLNALFFFTVLKKRLVKLVVNFLFYFRTDEAEPIGALLLEHCRITKEEDNVFSISFVEEPERKYCFECDSEEQCQEWIEALKRASYEFMRRSLIFYRNEIQKMTGKDPLEQYGISEEARFQLGTRKQ
uniref:Sesquipedalian n=1 Tax=Falco tinnunculus TaxID=100819 RepID=A0A8C4UH45_FALTI